MKLLLNWLLSTIAILITAHFLPGITVANFTTALLLALVLGLLNAIVKPILILITLPLNLLTLGLFTLIINGIIILLATLFVAGFHVSNIFWAILFSIIVSFITSLLQHFTK
jgi:putative membrane protein